MPLVPIAETYYEIIDSESPLNYSFSSTGPATAVITFLIDGTEIVDFINDVLGTARMAANTYCTRTLPASHPALPWLYATKIVDMKGYSPNGKTDAQMVKDRSTYKGIETRSPQFVGSYAKYKVTVQFEARDYSVISDADLQPFYRDRNYPMPTKNPITGVVDERWDSFRDRLEYLRFTNWTVEPITELLTWGASNYVGINPPGANPPLLPVQQQTSSMKNILLQKYRLNFKWYFVPYEMTVNNAIWQDAYSKINLNDFVLIATDVINRVPVDTYLFPAGTLLFKKVEVKKYEPYYPFANVDITANSSVFDFYTEYNKNQYCDVEFEFIYFQQPNSYLIPIGNGNIQQRACKDPRSFHNRLPDTVMSFWYYVESDPDISKASPIFFSYPFENLWNYREGA